MYRNEFASLSVVCVFYVVPLLCLCSQPAKKRIN
jgi:hypothetical protein